MKKYISSRRRLCYRIMASHVGLSFTFGYLILNGTTLLAQPGTQGRELTPSGADTCFACHNKATENAILETPHGIHSNLRSPFANNDCESCHGISAEHSRTLQSPSVVFGLETRQYLLSEVSVQNQMCLNCHQVEGRTLPAARYHQSPDLACASCHVIHTPMD